MIHSWQKYIADAIAIVAFLGCTVGFVIKWGHGLRMAWNGRGWPAVTGTIISSKIVIEDLGEGDTRHDSKVTYEYRVAGQVYRADRLEWSDGAVTGTKLWQQRWHERTVAAYPVGRNVTVYYDPADPSRAVLQPRRLRELLKVAAFASVTAGFVDWMVTR